MLFSDMNTGQLRSAARDAGIPYKGMSKEALVAALVAHVDSGVAAAEIEENLDNAAPVVQEVETGTLPAPIELSPETVFAAALQGVVDAAAASVAVAELDAEAVQVPEAAPVVQDPAPVEVAAPEVQIPSPELPARGTSKGLKIEKDRPMQNGIRMPSAGGLCREVWDFCTEQHTSGSMPTAKSVKAHAAQVGWNLNNASIEFYNWRKYNGISGRQA